MFLHGSRRVVLLQQGRKVNCGWYMMGISTCEMYINMYLYVCVHIYISLQCTVMGAAQGSSLTPEQAHASCRVLPRGPETLELLWKMSVRTF